MSVVDWVQGVTQLRDIIYIVCRSSTVLRFNSTTHERLTGINVEDLIQPSDIVACQQMCQMYVCDWEECIWRVSEDGEDLKCWLPKSPSDTFKPLTLSVTTSYDTQQLRQFDADGNKLRRV